MPPTNTLMGDISRKNALHYPGLFAIPQQPLQGVLKGSVSPESPALNWPAGQKRVQDRKMRLPTGAGVRALDATYNCPSASPLLRVVF